jgi:hypothetical protein
MTLILKYQSIKTRIETTDLKTAEEIFRIEVPGPLKQGLKLRERLGSAPPQTN